jgi:hypothetical protein
MVGAEKKKKKRLPVVALLLVAECYATLPCWWAVWMAWRRRIDRWMDGERDLLLLPAVLLAAVWLREGRMVVLLLPVLCIGGIGWRLL